MKLERSMIFKGLRKDLIIRYGKDKAMMIWEYANEEMLQMETYEGVDKTTKLILFPAIALYKAIEKYAPGEALEVTREYGTKTGLRIKGIFHKVSSLPGVPTMIWKNMDKIAARMSNGYTCRNVSVTDHECMMDVVGCPLFDQAKEMGVPEAVQMICSMDKQYMTGFRGLEYTRTKSLAEGDDCCDYRIVDTREKAHNKQNGK